MNSLLGTDKLNRVINTFVEQFDADASLDTEFYCDLNSNHIGYALVASKKATDDFMESVEWCKPEVDCDPFLWSILHEVGHIMTESDFDELDYAMHSSATALMIKCGCEKDYYHTPIEVAATRWAVDYANTHIYELIEFWAIAQPLLLQVYELNGVE